MKKWMLFLFLAMSMGFAQPSNSNMTWSEHRAAVVKAITDRDYEAWRAAHDSWNSQKPRPRLEQINAENFEIFAQMMEARWAGDFQKAMALRQELGIEPMGRGWGRGGQHRGWGQGQGQGQGRRGWGKGCGGGRWSNQPS